MREGREVRSLLGFVALSREKHLERVQNARE
jgi:hypothetical protein